MKSSVVGLALLSVVALAACGGGGGSGALPPTDALSNAAGSRTAAKPTAAPKSSSFAVTSVFGEPGADSINKHPLSEGASIAYDESVGFTFSDQVDPTKLSVTITPAVPLATQSVGNGILVTFRKTPGVTYAIAAQATSAAGGAPSPVYTIDLSVPRVGPIPAPSRSVRGPYRYMTLGQLYPYSYGPSDYGATKMMPIIKNSRVRGMRFEWDGGTIETSKGVYNFHDQDVVMDELAAIGVTEMPSFMQYNAPAWATGGKAYPEIWHDPADYAAFVAASIAHIQSRHPEVTQFEFGNETNGSRWGQFPTDPSAVAYDQSGKRACDYALAAYAAGKTVAPNAKFVGFALTSGGNGMTDPRTFVQTAYAEGCGYGKSWDILAVHSYDTAGPLTPHKAAYAYRLDVVKDLEAIASSYGDNAPLVLLGENGYSAGSLPTSVDPQVQALYEAQLFNYCLADAFCTGVVWVNVDIGYAFASTDLYGTMSLTDNTGAPLPGFAVMQAFAGG